jgi:hypothetical protein
VRTQASGVKDAPRKLRALFGDYDRSKDGNGKLVRREVRLCLEELGCELSNEEVRRGSKAGREIVKDEACSNTRGLREHKSITESS